MFLSYAATRVLNGDGIHICLSGSAGTGKSHTATTVAKHLPDGAVIDAGVSDKALYYNTSYKPGTVFILDDQELSDNFQEAIKKATTNWDEPTKYLTVINQKGDTLTIKERCPFWLVKANLTGDEQTHDRMLMIWTDESADQRVTIQQQIFMSFLDPNFKADTTRQNICKAIWNHVPSAIVILPFVMYILCDIWMDPRNTKMILSMTQAYALLRAPKRKQHTDDGNLVIEASINDFYDAANIFNPLLGNNGGSQKLKLSSNAAKVLDYLAKRPSDTISFREIRKALNLSGSMLSVALYGRDDRSSDGLEKLCPAIEVVSETIPYSSEPAPGKHARAGTFQQKSIKWDKESYDAWAASGGMFALDVPRMIEDGVFLDELEERGIYTRKETDA